MASFKDVLFTYILRCSLESRHRYYHVARGPRAGDSGLQRAEGSIQSLLAAGASKRGS